MTELTYKVSTFRKAGLEARWGKTQQRRPAIFVRDPNAKTEHQRTQWWLVNKSMFDDMKKEGIVEGFNSATIIGDIFSIPA